MAAAVAAGHARLRHRLCVHRLPAVQRPAAGGPAQHLWPGRPPAARGAQPGRRGVGVHLLALPLCVPAGAHGAGRTRRAPDGGCAPAGRAAATPHPCRGLAAGAPGRRRRGGAGADGNPGRLRRGQLLWHPDLHHGHLQGLAVHGQPPGRRAAGHHATGGGDGTAAPGAPRTKTHALCHRRRSCGLGRGAAPGLARRAPLGCLGGVRGARAHGLCGAGAVHAAPARGRLVGAAVGAVPGMGLAQRALRMHHRRAGRDRGAGAGLCRAPPARRRDARRGATGQRGLRSAGRCDRGGSAAARGLAAGGGAPVGRGRVGHGHGAGHCVGLPGALLRRGPAVHAKRLCAHPAQPGRLCPHAGRGQLRPAGAGALATAQALHRRRRAAGVCGRDEGAARHHGAAPLQQRHAGRGGLPAGTRRAPGRGVPAVAGAGGWGAGAGDFVPPDAAQPELSPRRPKATTR
eukprot:Opistho-2@7096